MKKERMIVPREKYLSAGVHIGMGTRTASMRRFIYKIRPNGLAVLNVGMLDKRIGYTANMLSRSRNMLIVSRKDVATDAVKKFAEVVGAKAITSRFMPGSLTNPTYRHFFEPDIIMVTDPVADSQAIKEAVKMRIPIIGLADTFNDTAYLDLVLPCNNRGKKSLALIFWILAKLITEKRAGIEPEAKEEAVEDYGEEEAAEAAAPEEPDKNFPYTLEDFGYE